jgi:hypothetical protein
MIRDYSYRQRRFTKVSGGVGFMHNGSPEPPLR